MENNIYNFQIRKYNTKGEEKMILEEEIKKAEQGNIGAMCRIGDHYRRKIIEEGYEQEYEEMALKYYKMAGEGGELYGMYWFVEMGNISVMAELSFAFHIGIQRGMERCEVIYEWSEKALSCIEKYGSSNEEMINRDMILSELYLASYHLALCYFFMDMELEVEQLISRIDKQNRGVEVNLLLAVNIIMGGSDGASRYQEAYNLLLEMEDNVEFAQRKKMEMEEDVYVFAAGFLATYFRGAFLNMTPDLNRSVKVLNFVKDNLQYEDRKAVLEKELRCYHKKLFGGYKYVSD